MADQALFDVIRALDANGDPVSGAELYAYEDGTSTPLTTYTTSAGSGGSAHPWPVVADSNGVFPPVFVEEQCKIDVQVASSGAATGASLPGYPIAVVPESIGGGSAAANISMTPTAALPYSNVDAALSALGTMALQSKDSVDIDGGAVDGTTIGANTAAAGTFTTANADTVIIDPDGATGGAGVMRIRSDGDDTKFEPTNESGGYGDAVMFWFDRSADVWKFAGDAQVDGTATLATVDINAGAIDGATIGANSAAPGTFTTFNSAGISDDANNTKLTVDDNGCHVGHDGSVTSNPAFNNTVGVSFNNTNHYMSVCRAANIPLYVGVQSDTTLTGYYSAGNLEGSVSVSGTTVSFNGGHLSRWSRLLSEETPLKGTVMSNLDDMIEWPDEENEQLNYTKISDVEGDPNVAGVFVAWDNTDDHGDFFLGMTGDLVIRIADGVSFNRGDLLISAGDGTAKPQADDIVRSSTIAKVISSEVTGTYEDGSRLVPCVLMAC
jgi:hypothetical protein